MNRIKTLDIDTHTNTYVISVYIMKVLRKFNKKRKLLSTVMSKTY